jgi:hypothetical protein
VVNRRCIAGIDTLVLNDAHGGGFSVDVRWTDLAPPEAWQWPGGVPGRLDPNKLTDLVDLVGLLASRDQRRFAK